MRCYNVFSFHNKKVLPEGDKFLLNICMYFTAIGIAMLYRIDYTYAIKQIAGLF